MREIASLIKLDLICIKKKSLLPMIAGVIVFAIFGFIMGPHFTLPISIFSGLTVYSMFSIAAKNDFGKLYGSLPIKRSNIIYARFIAALILIIVFMVILTIIAFISAEAGLFRNVSMGDEAMENMGVFYDELVGSGYTIMMTSVILFVAGCVFTAIEFILVFIFGVEKEIPVSIGLCTVIGLIIAIFVKLDIDPTEKIIKFFGDMMIKSEALLYVIFIVLGIAIIFLFAFITDIITRKREL